jgi:signal transduction histidine kinase
MSLHEYTFIGLTAIVAALVSVVTYAVLRMAAAARESGSSRHRGGDTAMLTAALQEAVAKVKADERALLARAEASERLSGEIISSLTAGLLVVRLDGEVRIINPAGRRLLGLRDDESFAEYRQLPQALPLAAVIDECLETVRPIVRRALELPAAGLRATHFGVTVSPLFTESGAVHGAICLFTDLTTVMDLEEQIRLKDSLARVGELTAGIAHEFRNGLATIHGYGRLIDLEAVPQPHRSYVEGIRAETEAMGQVVTNFLNFAKPEQLVVAPVDLQSIVERVADELRPDARSREGSIEVSGTFATVEGDDVLLRQAFSNLVRNAIEACTGAGVAPVVGLEAAVDHRKRVCRITVRDNGPGVDPAVRDRIFRPFFTTKGSGTGLGLALTLKIIVTHNGRLTVGTAPGLGGASFEVTLPLAPT